jgi:FKBP-type peptidyl-prolyl cis-trans isomerase
MGPFNKFEAIGIFASVAVMALALVLIRFNTDTFAVERMSGGEGDNVATVIATGDESTIQEEITDSVSMQGELMKLVIDDVRLGSGAVAQSGNTVTVHYKGTLRDGTVFDDSTLRGEPFVFTLGEGKVIQGWEEGIVGMQVGGERILVIPPQMAYGNRQVGPIPANSPLIFKVELLAIE